MSLSSCHMLWFLHFCAEANVIVLDYTDNASAIMVEESNGSGRFTEVVLHPHVVVARQDMVQHINGLHKKANQYCFIANSVNFLVKHLPTSAVHEQD